MFRLATHAVDGGNYSRTLPQVVLHRGSGSRWRPIADLPTRTSRWKMANAQSPRELLEVQRAPLALPNSRPTMPANVATDPATIISSGNTDAPPVRCAAGRNGRGPAKGCVMSRREEITSGCREPLEAIRAVIGESCCCFSHSLVGTPRELVGVFRRRISWDDGVMREPAGAGAVAFSMTRCCRSGGDVGARAPSVGKGWASAAHLSMPCPHGP